MKLLNTVLWLTLLLLTLWFLANCAWGNPTSESYRLLCAHWLEPIAGGRIDLQCFAACEHMDSLRAGCEDADLWCYRNLYAPIPIAWWDWDLFWRFKDEPHQ